MIRLPTIAVALAGCAACVAAGGCQPVRKPVGKSPTTMSALVTDSDAPASPSTAPAPVSHLMNGGQPATGRPCRVHLRRDAMGLSGIGPLSLQTSSPSARAVQLDGTLELASDRWLVLRTASRAYWIPTDVVLAIEYVDGR